MSIIAAKCPGCGGDIQLDDTNQHGFCMYCGTRVIVKDAIEETRVKIEGKVSVEGLASLEKLVQNAETFMALGEYAKALDVFRKAAAEYPADYRGWWGVVCALSHSFRMAYEENPEADDAYRAAMKLAPPERQASIKTEYEAWRAVYEVRHANEMIECLTSLTNHNKRQIAELRGRIPAAERQGESFQKKSVGFIVASLVLFIITICMYIASPMWRPLTVPITLGSAVTFIYFAHVCRKRCREGLARAERDQKSLESEEENLRYYQQSLEGYRQNLVDAQRRMARR